MVSTLTFGPNERVGEKLPVYIIAEIGQNHQGSVDLAKLLIKTAKECGANCAKFQKTCLEAKFNKAALLRSYTSEDSWGETYGEHKKCLEFSEEEFLELQSYAAEIGIAFTASAMDVKSLYFLTKIKVPFIKIGSGDANNMQLIEEAAKTNIPLVISTGMLTLDGVDLIYQTVSRYHKNFCLMHCVSSYPVPAEEVNLNVIKLYQQRYADINIGYSGHELGIGISLGAVAMGAKILEKHITLDCSLKGSDHRCSLEPHQFKQLVEQIRVVEAAMGKPEKQMQVSEKACYDKLSKTLVLSKSVSKGHALQLGDLTIKVAEPKGIDGLELTRVIGRIVKRDMDEDDSLCYSCLED